MFFKLWMSVFDLVSPTSIFLAYQICFYAIAIQQKCCFNRGSKKHLIFIKSDETPVMMKLALPMFTWVTH